MQQSHASLKTVCPRGGTLVRVTSLALATCMRVCRLTGVVQTYLRPGLGARIFSLRVVSSSGLSRYILSTKHTDLVMDEAGASLWSHHLPLGLLSSRIHMSIRELIPTTPVFLRTVAPHAQISLTLGSYVRLRIFAVI